MVSSGDELGSFQHSPQVDDNTARVASHSVAGPSKKRKRIEKTISTNNAGNNNVSSTAPISISSDEDTRPRSKAKRVQALMPPASNGKSGASKGKSQSPAPVAAPLRRKNATKGVEPPAGETDGDGGVTLRSGNVSSNRAHGNKEGAATGVDAQTVLSLRTAYKDIAQQRDDMAKKLEEIVRLRETEPERLKDEMKAQYEARVKGPLEDTVHEYELLTRRDELSQSGNSTMLHFLTRQTADQEKQDIQKDIGKLKNVIKEKDVAIARKDAENKELEDIIRTLRADLKTEIENTKALTSRNHPPATSKQVYKPDPKHAMVIRLYEELTGLLVTNVRHEPGQFKEDDAVYTCVQTTNGERSLNFTLKFFKDLEESDTPQKGGVFVDKVIYTPLNLEMESAEFIERLDFLAHPFTFQKSQMWVFTDTLKSHMEKGDDDQSEMDMEDE